MKYKIIIYRVNEFDSKEMKYCPQYKIKVEETIIDKFTSDGLYFTYTLKKHALKVLKEIKKQYPNHIVVDKCHILTEIGDKE